MSTHAPATLGTQGSGRPADVEALLRAGEVPVQRFLFGRLDTPEQAEDLTQETLVRAFCALRDGLRPARPLSWLLGIARNVLLETWRGERYRRALANQLSRAMGPSWAGAPDDVCSLDIPGIELLAGAAGRVSPPG